MTTSCTDLLEALRKKANFGKLRAFPSGDVGQGTGHNYEHIGAVGNGSRANYTVLAVNHLGPLVKALESVHQDKCYCDYHGPRESDCPHLVAQDALAALRTDLEAVLEVK